MKSFRKNFTLIELLVSKTCQIWVSLWCFFKKSTPLFFEREKGRGGKGKLSFPGKRKFSLSTAHGFTLIELLVVIAIIAILAAILLPTLQNARERGKSSSCIANLKNIASANRSYADTFDEFFPVSGNVFWENTTVNHYVWSQNLAKTGFLPEKYWGVCRCPSIPKSATVPEHNNVSTYGVAVTFMDDYQKQGIINWKSGTRSPAAPGFGKYTIFRNPSRAVTHADSIGCGAAANYEGYAYYQIDCANSTPFYQGIPFAVHNDSANYALADGHVASIKAGPEVVDYHAYFAAKKNLEYFDYRKSSPYLGKITRIK